MKIENKQILLIRTKILIIVMMGIIKAFNDKNNHDSDCMFLSCHVPVSEWVHTL